MPGICLHGDGFETRRYEMQLFPPVGMVHTMPTMEHTNKPNTQYPAQIFMLSFFPGNAEPFRCSAFIYLVSSEHTRCEADQRPASTKHNYSKLFWDNAEHFRYKKFEHCCVCYCDSDSIGRSNLTAGIVDYCCWWD